MSLIKFCKNKTGLFSRFHHEIGNHFKKSTEGFHQFSGVLSKQSFIEDFSNFSNVTHKLNLFFLFIFSKKVNMTPMPHNTISMEINFYIKIARSFFKKFHLMPTISYKAKFKGGRYFWVFRRKGYFYKKKKLLRKRLIDICVSEESALTTTFVKIKFFNLLKSYWSLLGSKKKIKYQTGVHDIEEVDENASIVVNTDNINEMDVSDDEIEPTVSEKIYYYFFKKMRTHNLWVRYNNIRKLSFEIFITTATATFFGKEFPFNKNYSFFFAREMVQANSRKLFTNYYIFKTFEHAFHNFWIKNEYPLLLAKLSCYRSEIFLMAEDWEHEFDSEFENLFELTNEFISTAFLPFKFKEFFRRKRKRKMGKVRRAIKKNAVHTKLNTVNFLIKRLTPFWYSSSNDVVLPAIYNNYFYNYFFLDIPNFSENFFENQEFISILMSRELISDQVKTSLTSSTFLKKKFLASNYMPVVLLSDSVKIALITQKKIITDRTDHRYMQNFITNFISHVTNFKSLFILSSNNAFFKSSLSTEYTYTIYEITSYFTKIHKKFFKNFQLPNFIEFFSFSLFKKDLNFFVKFFKKCLEEMPLKKHKRVLYSFEFMLKKFLKKFFIFTHVLGLKFEISGKISVAGNSKTRNKIIKYGYYSLTNKSLRIDYLYDTIRTITGVLGFRMYITY